MAPKTLSADTLKQDLPPIVVFLRLLEQRMPGCVDAETLAFLEQAEGNGVAREALARMLAGK